MELIEAKRMRTAFQNMFNLYVHELSKYNPWIGTQIDKEGNFLAENVNDYFTEQEFKAYCIVEGEHPIGLAVFSSCEEDGEWFHDVEEIFLVETSRHFGIVEKVCQDFWREHHGIGTLHVLNGNLKAIHYWDKLLDKCGYTYNKSVDETMTAYHFSLE